MFTGILKEVVGPGIICGIFHKNSWHVINRMGVSTQLACEKCNTSWWNMFDESEESSNVPSKKEADEAANSIFFPVEGRVVNDGDLGEPAEFPGFGGGHSGGAGAGGSWDEEKISAQAQVEEAPTAVPNEPGTESASGQDTETTNSDEASYSGAEESSDNEGTDASDGDSSSSDDSSSDSGGDSSN